MRVGGGWDTAENPNVLRAATAEEVGESSTCRVPLRSSSTPRTVLSRALSVAITSQLEKKNNNATLSTPSPKSSMQYLIIEEFRNETYI